MSYIFWQTNKQARSFSFIYWNWFSFNEKQSLQQICSIWNFFCVNEESFEIDPLRKFLNILRLAFWKQRKNSPSYRQLQEILEQSKRIWSWQKCVTVTNVSLQKCVTVTKNCVSQNRYWYTTSWKFNNFYWI